MLLGCPTVMVSWTLTGANPVMPGAVSCDGRHVSGTGCWAPKLIESNRATVGTVNDTVFGLLLVVGMNVIDSGCMHAVVPFMRVTVMRMPLDAIICDDDAAVYVYVIVMTTLAFWSLRPAGTDGGNVNV